MRRDGKCNISQVPLPDINFIERHRQLCFRYGVCEQYIESVCSTLMVSVALTAVRESGLAMV